MSPSLLPLVLRPARAPPPDYPEQCSLAAQKRSLMAAALEDPDGRSARREQMAAAPRTDVATGTGRRIRFAVPAGFRPETENAAGNWH